MVILALFESIMILFSDLPLVTYPGPLNVYPHIPVYLASYFLPYFLGDRFASNETERDSCKSETFSAEEDEIHTYVWMRDLFGDENTTFCMRSTVRQSLAKSPAFEIESKIRLDSINDRL